MDKKESYLELAFKYRKDGNSAFAMNNLLKAANKDKEREAMYQLGHAYVFGGWGAKRDPKVGMEWFRKSAEAGHGAGMAFYAQCLQTQKRDLVGCNAWGHNALLSKDLLGSAHCYGNGYGVPYDPIQSDKIKNALVRVAAREGNEIAQHWRADAYYLEKNYTKALVWYHKAGEQGYVESQFRLARMYECGDGVPQNTDAARIWYKKAATQGYTQAIEALKTF